MIEKLSLNRHRIGECWHTLAWIGQSAALGGDEKLTPDWHGLAPEALKDWVRMGFQIGFWVGPGLAFDWHRIGSGLAKECLRIG